MTHDQLLAAESRIVIKATLIVSAILTLAVVLILGGH
jgi:hypothetical protein